MPRCVHCQRPLRRGLRLRCATCRTKQPRWYAAAVLLLAALVAAGSYLLALLLFAD